MGKINGVDIIIITKLNGKNLVDITKVKGKSTELIPSWPRRPPPECSPTLLRGPAPSERIVCDFDYITYDFNISSELIFLEGYCGNTENYAPSGYYANESGFIYLWDSTLPSLTDVGMCRP